ncbi:MAG TPA: SET domain-containing protein-lysine N-methyltransferase [Candidatus Tenderia sp.]|nr:SET domain-containing protein-lysine N-methyltransferase [Candidatus Tenderia sp.]
MAKSKKKKVQGKVYVKKSAIHGLGLFANKKIKKGELIGEIDKAIPSQEDGPHVLWLSEGDGYRVKGPMKYINHSAKPNAVYYDDFTVVALRNIKADEEITHYYGEGWD